VPASAGAAWAAATSGPGSVPAGIRPAESPGAAPFHNALIIIAIPERWRRFFAASNSLALGWPTPHHITVALIGY